MTTYRFENPMTRGVYHSAILSDNLITVDGDTCNITWQGDAEPIGEVKCDYRWGRQGTMQTEDGPVPIMLAWEQWDIDAEDQEDACEWGDPDYLYIDGQQLDRIRPEDLNCYYVAEVQDGGYREASEIKACDLISAQRQAEEKQMFQGTELVIGARVDNQGFIPDDAVLSVYSHGAWREA